VPLIFEFLHLALMDTRTQDDIIMEEESADEGASDFDMEAEGFEDMSDIDEHYLDDL